MSVWRIKLHRELDGIQDKSGSIVLSLPWLSDSQNQVNICILSIKYNCTKKSASVLECLLKYRMLGPHILGFWFSGSRLGTQILNFNQVLR